MTNTRPSPGPIATCTATEAACELGVTPATVRRWLASGAPCARARRPRLVVVDELRRWRDGDTGDVLERVAGALLDAQRRELDDGRPAHEVIGVSPRASALLLLVADDRIHRAITGAYPVEPYPDAVMQLCRIAERTNAR